MLNIGIVGYGYWGPNVARNFKNCNDVNLIAISDLNESRLKLAKYNYPYVNVFSDARELIQSDDVQAVAIVTPVFTHYELAKAALEKGKHIFVEKPFTSNAREAEELINCAKKTISSSWSIIRSCSRGRSKRSKKSLNLMN